MRGIHRVPAERARPQRPGDRLGAVAERDLDVERRHVALDPGEGRERAETSRPVTASRSGAAERVSSSAPDSFGSARSSTSASDSAPEPDVDVTVTRYRANAVGSATVKGRVCRAQRNCSPDRSSSVVHVSPSSEPSRVHADGDAVPLAPEVSVYDPTVGRMPLPAHVIDGVEVANVVRVPDVLSVSAAALVVASPSATVVVPRPAVVASCTGVGARRPR